MAATKSLIAGAALAAGVSGLRTGRKGGEKTIAGVVVHHYNERQVQKAGQEMQIASNDAVFDWVVMFNQGATIESIDELCADAPACVSSGDSAAVPYATVRGTETQLGGLLERHAQNIMFVEPDMPLEEPDLPLDEEMSIQAAGWNLEKVGVPQARYTGKGSHIYVMDTGVRTTHQDFGGRAIPTIDTVLGSGRIVECEKRSGSCATDSNGHGTHCAGTAGGATYGVAKEATVHAMKVCCGYGSNILAGMDWLVSNKIRPAVMTMSLGSYSMPESSRVAVDAVVAAGITVTVSAGNRNVDSCTKSYTFIASAIGVGSTTQSNSRSSFSNWGSCNAIYAPGSSIVSASSGSDTGSSTKSGTSMAAPCVAGAVALLLEESPSASPQNIRTLLRSRATKNALSGLKAGDPNLLLNVA